MNLLMAQVGRVTQNVADGTQSELAVFVSGVIAKIPLWIAAIMIFVISIFVAKIIRNTVENKITEKGLEEEHQEIPILAGRAAYVSTIVIGTTAALKIAGIDITSIIAAVAFGLGFALKDLIMNFLAGIMILMSRQFTIGDYIKVNDTIGRIVEIQSRATILQAFDGTKIVVPNARLFTNEVTSFTSNPFRRFEIIVGVDYRSDLQQVSALCLEALKETPGVLAEPEPGVIAKEFGDSAITFGIRGWIESKGGIFKVRSDALNKIKEKFDAHGIVIPWPIRTIAYDKEQAPLIPDPKVKAEQKREIKVEVQPGATSTLTPETQPVPIRSDESEEPNGSEFLARAN